MIAANPSNMKYLKISRLASTSCLNALGGQTICRGSPTGTVRCTAIIAKYPQVVVFVENLKLLQPPVVGALQQVVKEFPGWQIDLMVTLRGHEDWPNMGISIRVDEIVDDLQRQYFPSEYQNLAYEHSRQGNVLDRWRA